MNEAALRQLIGAGAVGEIVAVGGSGGFVIALKLGESDAILGSSLGKTRVFASISTIALLLRRLGQPRFTVDATDFVPGRVRPAQPERSAAMRAGKLPKAAAKRAAPNTKMNKK
ncbi:hypothetical protein [Variovorax sp. 770b2]|uniref:hypothetical protein n=1 Tax=Variovorax sp. 770b2 TaxID=1566271 RepID=UPI000B829869|nr:hypothetical protein [Variovorax sp. 770b2]